MLCLQECKILHAKLVHFETCHEELSCLPAYLQQIVLPYEFERKNADELLLGQDLDVLERRRHVLVSSVLPQQDRRIKTTQPTLYPI